jgi:hypothetical protein
MIESVSADGQILKKADRLKYNQTEPSIPFYYRENLEEGRLWYRPTIGAKKYLMADLSLEIGNTTKIFHLFLETMIILLLLVIWFMKTIIKLHILKLLGRLKYL